MHNNSSSGSEVVFPVPLGAHEHRLLGTGDNFHIRFDGSAQEYDDAASLGYDDDDDDDDGSPSNKKEWEAKVVDNPHWLPDVFVSSHCTLPINTQRLY